MSAYHRPSSVKEAVALLGAGFTDKWENPNLYAPFNLTGAPALVLCNGYTDSGLPLAMQIAGRPFDETTVLRAGHAYEQATPWRARRPLLTAGQPQPPLAAPPSAAPAADIDAGTRNLLDAALARAGYRLTERQRQLVYRVAPYVLAAAQRIPRDQQRSDEPAAVFHFAGD